MSVASDSDSEPYLIYIDPITGKYTQRPPTHSAVAKDELTIQGTTAQPIFYTRPSQVLLISGGLIFLSHLIATLFALTTYVLFARIISLCGLYSSKYVELTNCQRHKTNL